MVSFDAAGYCKYNTTSVETAGGTVFASLKKKKQGGGKKKPWVKRKRCQVVRKRIRIISTYVNFKKSWPKPSVCGQQIVSVLNKGQSHFHFIKDKGRSRLWEPWAGQ